jgi:hypothetical protein
MSTFPEHANNVWSGWTINWQRDAFEFQLATGNGHLRFPMRSETWLTEQITARLLFDKPRSSVDFVLKVAEKHHEEGNDLQINPVALRDDYLDIPIEERRRIVETALG